MTAPDTGSTGSSGEGGGDASLYEAFGELAGALATNDELPSRDEAAAAEPAAEPTATAAPAASEKPQAAAAPADRVDKAQASPAAPAGEKPGERPGEKSAEEIAPEKEPERQPLAYTVDGQQKLFDGGFVVPGLGAVITNDALPRLQDRLQQADRLAGQNQQLYQQVQRVEKLGGIPAFEKNVADRALLDASAVLLLRSLTDERTLFALATDPVARQQLLKELDLVSREASMRATSQFRETQTREAQQASSAQSTQTVIERAVTHLAKENFPALTAEDVTAVRAHASRFATAIIRPATPDEARRANVQPGAPIIDLDSLNALLADRHELRKQASVAAQRRQTDALENQARAAAAAPTTVQNGHAPAKPRPGAGKPAAPQQKPVDKMSSVELMRAMKSGRIFEILDQQDDES